jgi:hypothetical protein
VLVISVLFGVLALWRRLYYELVLNRMSENPRAVLLESILGKSEQVYNAIRRVLADPTPPGGAPDLHPGLLERAKLANTLADMTNDNKPLITKFISDPAITTLRDVALNHPMHLETSKSSPSQKKTLMASDQPDGLLEASPDLSSFQSRLFQAEPSAVLHRMVSDKQVRSPLRRPGVDCQLTFPD